MTIKKALEHFKWKFQNKWKPTEADLKALDCIIDFVNDKHQQQFNDNQLFAKLYITFYGELLIYFQSSVFDKIPQREINRICDEPIELTIKKFIQKATDAEGMSIMREKGIPFKHPRAMTKEEKKKWDEIDIIKFGLPVMTYEEAESNLTSMINLALNAYN